MEDTLQGLREPFRQEGRGVPEDRPRLAYFASAPAFAAERALREVWARVLGVEHVGLHDDFFELGGSIDTAVTAVAGSREAGLPVSLYQMLQYPTVAGLAHDATRGLVAMPCRTTGAGEVPLTPIQLAFFAELPVEPHHSNFAALVELRTPFESTAVRSAATELVDRHQALRLRFVPRADGGWGATIAPAGEPVSVCHVDVRGCPAKERQAAVVRVANDTQTSFDLTSGPLIRFVIVDEGGQRRRLLVVAHRLVADSGSWGVLLGDLVGMIHARHGAGTLTGRESLSAGAYRHRVEELAHQARSSAVAGDAQHWSRVAQVAGSCLPIDRATGVNDVASAECLEVGLGAEQTRLLLHDVPDAYRTQLDEVLLAALLRAFRRWTGEDSMLVELGRACGAGLCDDVDLSHVVGPFGASFPVELRLTGEGPGQMLRSVKEQLRSVPRDGLSYGLLRFLSPDDSLVDKLRSAQRPEVKFELDSSGGQGLPDDVTVVSGSDWVGSTESLAAGRRYLLEIRASISGGRLVTRWTFSRNRHQRRTVEQLARDFTDELGHLIQHCLFPDAASRTPSDFALAAIDSPTLERLIGQDRGVEDIYPLSPLQQATLYRHLKSPSSPDLVGQLRCTVDGLPELPAFEAAWRHALGRHDTLRSGFVWDQLDRPLQIVRRKPAISVEQHDWSELEPGERAQKLNELGDIDLTKEFRLDAPPLLRLTLVRIAEATHALILTYHRIVLDAWSVAGLIKEVLVSYEGFVRRRAIPLDPPSRYRDHIAALESRSREPVGRFWRRTLRRDTCSKATPLTSGAPIVAGEVELPAKSTDELEAFARDVHVPLSTVVHGAWALVVGCKNGDEPVVVGSTLAVQPAGSARVGATLGPFCNTLPLAVPASDSAVLSTWLAELRDRQFELERHACTSLHEVRRHLELAAGRQVFDSAVVCPASPIESIRVTWPGAPEVRDVRHIADQPSALVLVARPGHRLGLEVRVDPACVDPDEAGRLLRRLESLLRRFPVAPSVPLGVLREHLAGQERSERGEREALFRRARRAQLTCARRRIVERR